MEDSRRDQHLVGIRETKDGGLKYTENGCYSQAKEKEIQ